jgi:hypothetical protein
MFINLGIKINAGKNPVPLTTKISQAGRVRRQTKLRIIADEPGFSLVIILHARDSRKFFLQPVSLFAQLSQAGPASVKPTGRRQISRLREPAVSESGAMAAISYHLPGFGVRLACLNWFIGLMQVVVGSMFSELFFPIHDGTPSGFS